MLLRMLDLSYDPAYRDAPNFTKYARPYLQHPVAVAQKCQNSTAFHLESSVLPKFVVAMADQLTSKLEN